MSQKKKKGTTRSGERGRPRPSETRPTDVNARWVFTGALAVFVLAFLLYAGTLGHEFVWDDNDLIVKNPDIERLDAGIVTKLLTEGFWPESQGRMDRRYQSDQTAYYRPLSTLSYHVDYKLYRGKPDGFHLTNVMINALTCSAVFVFVYLLFGSVLLASVTTLLFVIHPVHTESVAWISGRTDVLATFWSLVSLILYVVARKRGSAILIGGSIVAFAFGLLSKEVAAVVPLVVVLLEFGPFESLTTFHSEHGKSRRELRRRAAIVSLLYFAVLILYLVVRHSVLGTVGAANRAIAPGALGFVALPLSLIVGYVQKVFYPVVLTAEFLVPIPRTIMEPRTLLGAVLFAGMVYSVLRFRKRPTVVLGMGLFLFGIAPVLHIVPIAQLAAERFLYLPSLGVCLIIGDLVTSALIVAVPSFRSVAGLWAAFLWPMARPVALLLTLAATVAVLAGTTKTVIRNEDWTNNESLFSTTASQVPDSPRILLQTAAMAQQRGDIDEAIRAYESALRLAPDFAVPHWNLALIFLQQGESARARPHLLKAAEAGRDFRAAYYHLARIELSEGNTSQARAYANQFLQLYEKDDAFRREAAAIAAGETGD